ncbi:MAG TPA: ribbon-helix-helix domain-containing protein [Nitrososphaerales archaeon]
MELFEYHSLTFSQNYELHAILTFDAIREPSVIGWNEYPRPITLKVPTSFLKDFDTVTEQLGYPRNEAIREAMRRFVDWGYQKVNERHPERAMGLVQGVVSSLFGGIIEESKKLEGINAPSEQPQDQTNKFQTTITKRDQVKPALKS